MPRSPSIASIAVVGLLASSTLLSTGCGGRMPRALADGSGRIAPCPSSPNCVSSEATDDLHAIAPFRLRGDGGEVWQGLIAHLDSLPRVEIVTAESGYLHAVFTSRLMHYRDDVEFALDAPARLIRVRSASRVGYGDMGVNRDRIESIRAVLAERGLVEPGVGVDLR
jgi:uncharacterized protein (DUF1499 family)